MQTVCDRSVIANRKSKLMLKENMRLDFVENYKSH